MLDIAVADMISIRHGCKLHMLMAGGRSKIGADTLDSVPRSCD
jgi:hypothetical protein